MLDSETKRYVFGKIDGRIKVLKVSPIANSLEDATLD